MTTSIPGGATAANPILIPSEPLRQHPAPLAPAAPQMNPVPAATDPRGEKRGREKEGPDAVEASDEPQFKRARVESPPQDLRVPLLFAAIARGDIAGVEALLTQSPGLRDAYGPEGRTPLCDAAAQGQQAIAGLLLKLGAPVDQACRAGGTPLMFAARFGHVAVMRMLCLSGANPEYLVSDGAVKGANPLVCAIRGRQLAACKTLLLMGVDFQSILPPEPAPAGKLACTPLLLAFSVDFSALISWLLETGRLAVDSVEPSSKMSMVNAAAYSGAANSVELLLRKGANPIQKQVGPDGKTYDGVLAFAERGNRFHVVESALRFRETAVADKSKWPMPPLHKARTMDLVRHADLWLSPMGKAADGLKDDAARQNAAAMQEMVARGCSQPEVCQADSEKILEKGWLTVFGRGFLLAPTLNTAAEILGKNSFMRATSTHNRRVSVMQALQMLVESASLNCGMQAVFSGGKLTPQTELVMNRMFDLQRTLILDAIQKHRTMAERRFRTLPELTMEVYISRSGKLNEPDLYRSVTKDMGLFDPVARAVLRLVKDAYTMWRDLDPARRSDEFKALSPSQQFQSIMVSLLEDRAEPAEFEAARKEGKTPAVTKCVSELLKQQWRLFADAFGVSWPQASRFGPHKPVVVPAEEGMDVDVETTGEEIEEVVENDAVPT